MIVRIQGEGQFELAESDRSELERLDSELFATIHEGHPKTFDAAVAAVAKFVERQGTPVPLDRLVASDIILPASDTSLDEARRLLTDEGLLEPVDA